MAEPNGTATPTDTPGVDEPVADVKGKGKAVDQNPGPYAMEMEEDSSSEESGKEEPVSLAAAARRTRVRFRPLLPH